MMRHRYKFIQAHTLSYGGNAIMETVVFRIESMNEMSDAFLNKVKSDYFGDDPWVRIIKDSYEITDLQPA